jgi:hypothetical protein
VDEEAEATRDTQPGRMTQGHEIRVHVATTLEREERTGCAEPRPGGAGIRNSPGVGIEWIHAEPGLQGTLEGVKERTSPRPEDEHRTSKRKEALEAKGRRNERVVATSL